MGLTALQQHGEGLGAAAVAEYRGARTAARFGDPQAESAALRDSCAVYDLGYRAKIALTGADRVRWLNGMITNNIRDLAAGHGVYGFLLNPQGHILGDLYAYNRGPSITVDTDLSQIEKILAAFEHYIIMDDVEVTRLRPADEGVQGSTDQGAADAPSARDVTALGMGGPKAREVMRKAKMEIPDLRPLELREIHCDGDCGRVQCTVVRTDEGIESYEIWLAPEQAGALWNRLVTAGASPIGFEALELHRIVSGIPRYGVDIRERDLPQETGQARALNFNKGCYIGQEIVERIRSRGAVHRTFSGFLAEGGGEAIAPATRIVAGEKEVGEITSAATIRAGGGDKTVALGYIRRELGAPGREVLIGGVKAHVIPLPVPHDMLAQANPLARHSA
jgi:folate-binding protein YgfZ